LRALCSLRPSLLLLRINHGARQRENEAVLAAGGGLELPSLKKPAEAIGLNMNVPGAYWDGCAAADKKKIYVCAVRQFDALHKFAGGQPPSAAFEV
jgi:hypothetical protein